MTPSVRTLQGSKTKGFQGSTPLCPRGSNTRGFSNNGEDNLPHPFVGDLNYKKLLAIDYFEKMWRKNSDAMGGDPFVLKDIWYTANGMYVLVKFEV